MMYLHTESTFRCDVHFICWWWCTLWSADGDFTQCETCHKFIIKLCGSVFQCSSCSVYFHRNTYWHYPYYPIGGQVHITSRENGYYILEVHECSYQTQWGINCDMQYVVCRVVFTYNLDIRDFGFLNAKIHQSGGILFLYGYLGRK